MSAFGGHFAWLAVISEQGFTEYTEVAAFQRYFSYGNSDPCISEWPLHGGVRYLECPL